MDVLLNDEQRSWIARNFFKIADAQKDGNKKRIVKKIANKMIMGKVSVNLSKVEAGVILQAANVGLKALEAAENRYKQDEAKYSEYLKKVTEKYNMLQGIVTKIEVKLL